MTRREVVLVAFTVGLAAGVGAAVARFVLIIADAVEWIEEHR